MDSQATHASHKHVAIEAIEALRRMDTTAAEATVADIKAQKGCISLGNYVGRLGLDPGSEDGCPNAALAPMTAAVYYALTQGEPGRCIEYMIGQENGSFSDLIDVVSESGKTPQPTTQLIMDTIGLFLRKDIINPHSLLHSICLQLHSGIRYETTSRLCELVIIVLLNSEIPSLEWGDDEHGSIVQVLLDRKHEYIVFYAILSTSTDLQLALLFNSEILGMGSRLFWSDRVMCQRDLWERGIAGWPWEPYYVNLYGLHVSESGWWPTMNPDIAKNQHLVGTLFDHPRFKDLQNIEEIMMDAVDAQCGAVIDWCWERGARLQATLPEKIVYCNSRHLIDFMKLRTPASIKLLWDMLLSLTTDDRHGVGRAKNTVYLSMCQSPRLFLFNMFVLISSAKEHAETDAIMRLESLWMVLAIGDVFNVNPALNGYIPLACRVVQQLITYTGNFSLPPYAQLLDKIVGTHPNGWRLSARRNDLRWNAAFYNRLSWYFATIASFTTGFWSALRSNTLSHMIGDTPGDILATCDLFAGVSMNGYIYLRLNNCLSDDITPPRLTRSDTFLEPVLDRHKDWLADQYSKTLRAYKSGDTFVKYEVQTSIMFKASVGNSWSERNLYKHIGVKMGWFYPAISAEVLRKGLPLSPSLPGFRQWSDILLPIDGRLPTDRHIQMGTTVQDNHLIKCTPTCMKDFTRRMRVGTWTRTWDLATPYQRRRIGVLEHVLLRLRATFPSLTLPRELWCIIFAYDMQAHFEDTKFYNHSILLP